MFRTHRSICRWAVGVVATWGALAIGESVAHAQYSCANRFDPSCLALTSGQPGQAQIRPARPRSAWPPQPTGSENPGIGNLPGRISGELTSPVTDGAYKRFPRVGKAAKLADRVQTWAEPSPGDVFCGAIPPGPQRLACQGFVDASWPEAISRKQGLYTPDDLAAEGRRIQSAQNPCFPREDPMWGEVRGVRARRCKQAGEFTDAERASVDEANRTAASWRQRVDQEFERQRQRWMNGPQEDADFLRDRMSLSRQMLDRPGFLTRAERAEVERQLSWDSMRLGKFADRGIVPTPPAPAVAPLPPYRVTPLPRPAPLRPNQPKKEARPYTGSSEPRCPAGASCGIR